MTLLSLLKAILSEISVRKEDSYRGRLCYLRENMHYQEPNAGRDVDIKGHSGEV